jgi:hypothetical protein
MSESRESGGQPSTVFADVLTSEACRQAARGAAR